MTLSRRPFANWRRARPEAEAEQALDAQRAAGRGALVWDEAAKAVGEVPLICPDH